MLFVGVSSVSVLSFRAVETRRSAAERVLSVVSISSSVVTELSTVRTVLTRVNTSPDVTQLRAAAGMTQVNV